MVVCPVCEHQQQASFECEVCGRDLSALAGLSALPPPPPVAIELVPGLEATGPGSVGDVPVERMPDLEIASFPKIEVPLDVTPDLEPSFLPRVGDVAVEKLELADERAPDDGVRTAAPEGQVVCRYCKNVQQSGTQCDRCGMKLPAALLTLEPEIPPEEWVRCRACGAPGPAGQRCKECGKVIDAPAE